MKKIIIVLLAIFSVGQITGQRKTSRNLDELRQKVHNANPEVSLLDVLDLNIVNFVEDNHVTYKEEFELTTEEDLLDMFKDIIEARQEKEISRDIWDNLNVGVIFKGSVNADGSINIEGYIGNMNMPGGVDVDLGIGNPNGEKGNNSYAGRGHGRNKGSGVGDINNPIGNYGSDGFRGVPGQGHSSAGGNSWNVDATHSSSKNSDGNGTSSFIHHTSSVSNDSGYHSETDKQHVGNSDGSYVTSIHVSQTQPDGSNATCDKTVTKDADGNKKTTTTVTKTDADGNETSKKTTTKEEDTYENPMDEENGGNNAPPGPIEMQMAVYRAVALNSLAGGSSGDANDPRGEANQNSDGNGMININDGSKLGNFKPKTTGGKLKSSNRKTNTINPGRVNLKKVNKTIKN